MRDARARRPPGAPRRRARSRRRGPSALCSWRPTPKGRRRIRDRWRRAHAIRLRPSAHGRPPTPPRADAEPAAQTSLPFPSARARNRRTADGSDTSGVRRRSATTEDCRAEPRRSFPRCRRGRAPRRTSPMRTRRERRSAAENRVASAAAFRGPPQPDIRRRRGRREATAAFPRDRDRLSLSGRPPPAGGPRANLPFAVVALARPTRLRSGAQDRRKSRPR